MSDAAKTASVKPASDLRILDLATFVAAPFAASLMGEFGADVIKIEQAGAGDPWRKYGTICDDGDSLAWKSEARNKRSLTLNLRKPEGVEIFKRLVANADVVCENFRPGTLEKWGLGWDVLFEINPRLILLRVSGYGQDGPYRDRPGFARIAHAFAGLVHLAGMPDGPPVTPGSTSLADYLTGLFSALGIMMALRARDKTGRGQVIDVCLYEAIFRVLDELAPAYAATGRVRGPEGTKTLYAVPHGHYQTSDDKWVAIACTSDRMFARFAQMIGRPELAAAEQFGDISKRLAAYDEVDAIVTDHIRACARDAFLDQCIANEVPAAPVNTIADIFDDPHVQARKTLLNMPDDDGNTFVVPNVVPRLSETPGSVDTLGPGLGRDTMSILQDELGFSSEEIEGLSSRGIV